MKMTFDQFFKAMQNRLRMGALRYGRGGSHGVPDDSVYDMILQAEKCIARYRKSGNLEHVVDAANYCLLEAARPLHPAAHFRALDSNKVRWTE